MRIYSLLFLFCFMFNCNSSKKESEENLKAFYLPYFNTPELTPDWTNKYHKIPFFSFTNQNGKTLNNYKNYPQKSSEVKSIYRSDFDVHYDMHAGMNYKPLAKYDPSSYRSRLATGGIVMPHKNMSIVEIGDRRYFS